MFLNWNVIHKHSKWLCWKAKEKFQVEFRFCKTTGWTYVTLLTTYLAKKKKKTMLKVSYRNTRKICLLISKIILKTSERCHLTTSFLLEVTVQNYILDILQCQFAIKSLPSVLLSSSTAHNFNSSRPMYVVLREMKNNYRTIWFIKNSKCQHFLFLKKQPKKLINFSTFYLQRAAISVSQS